MRDPGVRPPGGIWRLLWLLVPHRDRTHLRDEVASLHAARTMRWGQRRADRWYRREVLTLAMLAPLDTFRRALRNRRQTTRGRITMGWMIADLRQALRGHRGNPGFAAVAVGTLALGIGASTAVFSLAHGVVLNPLPYPDPDRLVWLAHGAPGVGADDVPMARSFLPIYRDRSETVEEIGVWRYRSRTLTDDPEPMRAQAAEATASLFAILGARPLHGRLFLAEDDRPDGERVAVLDHGLWRQRYGADPGIVGDTVEVAGTPVTVIGVLGPDFAPPGRAVDLWLDASTFTFEGFSGFNSNAVGRMRPGESVDSVRRDLDARIAEIKEARPDFAAFIDEALVASRPVSLKSHLVGSVERTMWVLLGSVAVVLLIACANVANLLLVRAESRHRDTAVRRALGASSLRLAGQSLVESAMLASLGGLLGLGLAATGVRALVAWAPVGLPRIETVGINLAVLAFAGGVTTMVAVVFGFAPLLGSAFGIADALREGGKQATSGRRRLRLRHVLIVGQVALALLLIVSGGLMVRSFQRLTSVDPGFDPAGVLTFEVSPSGSRYADEHAIADFHVRLLDRLRELPGATAAGAVQRLPLGGTIGGNVLYEEGKPPEPGSLPPVVWVNRATAGYFETLRIPLLAGRTLAPSDLSQGTKAVVINAALAELFWPGEDPLGKRVSFNFLDDPEWCTVVGIVDTAKVERLTEDDVPMLFTSMTGGNSDYAVTMSYAVRASVPPLALADAVRRAVWDLDAGLAVVRLRAAERIVDEAQAPMAFTTVLLLLSASVAVALGSVGVYGVIAYAVRQRTAEIGVRIALGARGSDVRRQVLGRGALLGLLGVGLGLGGSLLSVRLLETLLYRIDPLDPVSYAAGTLLLLGVVLLASWLPALRASRVDPVIALRR